MPVDWWVWAAFAGFILVLLVFHRTAHAVSLREAALSSAIWVALGLGFMGFVWLRRGGTSAGKYLAGYLIEKSPSVDNIFVFARFFTARGHRGDARRLGHRLVAGPAAPDARNAMRPLAHDPIQVAQHKEACL